MVCAVYITPFRKKKNIQVHERFYPETTIIHMKTVIKVTLKEVDHMNSFFSRIIAVKLKFLFLNQIFREIECSYFYEKVQYTVQSIFHRRLADAYIA